MKIRTLKSISSGAVFLIVSCGAGLPTAMAQEAGQEAEQEAVGIEEVVVTARKREENLQEVPVSISSFSATDIEAMSMTNLKELGQFTTNFNFFNHGQLGGTSAIVFMRGIGQVDPSFSFESGVGIYADGVYLGRMQGSNLDLGELERVEILRGPQGTLFGRNTMGGAVNLVSAKPTDELEGYVEITGGEYNRTDATASINLPLVPGVLAARLYAGTRNRDGFGGRFDRFTGEKIDDMGNVDRVSAKALIDWNVSDDINVLLSFDGMRAHERGPVRKVVAYNAPGTEDVPVFLLNMFVEPDFGNAFLTDSDFTNYSNGLNVNDTDVWGVSLTVDWDLDSWTLKSITAYRDMDVFNGVDPDGSIYTIINQHNDLVQDQFSQEFQFSGLSFDDRLDWVFGLYYFTEDGRTIVPVDVFRELKDFIGLDLSFTTDQLIDNQSYSAYGQSTYQLTDKLSMTTGLRVTHDKKEVTRTQFRHLSGIVLAPWDTAGGSWTAVTGRLGFEYQWNSDIMTYVSMARGYKGGGINARGLTLRNFVPFDPEYIWTYEAGLRSDWADNRVRFNASAFYSDYSDIQVSVIQGSEGAEPVAFIANAAKARIVGFESDLIVAPAPGLNLSAGVGLTDAEYRSFAPDFVAPINKDTPFVKTPKWSVTLAGEYTVPVGGWGQLTARADWVHKSKVSHDAVNSPNVVQESYGLLNAKLSLEVNDGAWLISVFGTNLTDKHYIMAGTDFLSQGLDFAEVQFGRPREWGVSVKYNF